MGRLDYQPLFGKMSPHSSPRRRIKIFGEDQDRTRETAEIEPRKWVADTKLDHPGGGGGVLLGILGGGVAPGSPSLTRSQTKKCNFPHPFSDQTFKIHTRFQMWPLGRSYVMVT